MPRLSRQTKQKEIIREELKGFDSFFAAEDLYAKVKKKDAKIRLKNKSPRIQRIFISINAPRNFTINMKRSYNPTRTELLNESQGHFTNK